MKFWSPSLYYSSLRKRVNVSMKTQLKQSKKLKMRKRTTMKNKKKDLKGIWTQQRVAPENPGICV